MCCWARGCVLAAVAALGVVLLRPGPTLLDDYETGVDEALARPAEEATG